MKKLIYWLLLIGGAYLAYRTVDFYFMWTFIGIYLAFGITLIKLHLGDALRLWGIVFGFLGIMLGGAVIIAREWSEFLAGVWIFICIVLFMIFQKKLMRLIPIFYLAEKFEEVVREKSKELHKDDISTEE